MLLSAKFVPDWPMPATLVFLLTVEHIFEVSVEGIKGLKLLDNMIWGEADCFIQYHFPAQTQTKQHGGPSIMHGRDM